MKLRRLIEPGAYLSFASNRWHAWRRDRIRSSLSSRALPPADVNAWISGALNGRRPFVACRMGHVETTICWHFLSSYSGLSGLSGSQTRYPDDIMRSAHTNAGIYAPDARALDRFASIYLAALPHADLIGMWDVRGMWEIVSGLGAPGGRLTGIGELEPWDAHLARAQPWPLALEGKTVLVVHPFASTIEAQYRRKSAIKTICDILPELTLKTLVPPVTFAGDTSTRPWEENLQDLMRQVSAQSFDVALIGCGAYGLPLAAFVKQLGRHAIHLGGATQLLFGIRGRRWDENEFFARLMDDTWVRPLEEERPKGAEAVEAGCYW